MKGALIILAVTVIIGCILYILDRFTQSRRKNLHAPSDQPEREESPERSEESVATEETQECCGLHLVCEKELDAISRNEILYYDDEELDRFAERDPDSYTSEETEEFRDVLMTLLPIDVPGWARSLDARKIRPPREIRDELLILLSDIA